MPPPMMSHFPSGAVRRLTALGLLGLGWMAQAAPVPKPVAVQESFYGVHQPGIATQPQRHIYFMAFDLVAGTREEVIALLKAWTSTAVRLTETPDAPEGAADPDAVPRDSGDTVGLGSQRLTITFGFGPGLFSREGVDRYGLAGKRPEAFVDLPRFPGDQLVPERTGGDLAIQICADDPQVCFHAGRELSRAGGQAIELRWVQSGFLPGYAPSETPRNLMGFKDGTLNVPTGDAVQMAQHVWVGDEGAWMKGGSYMVVRPIRIALEHWEEMKRGYQEQVVGRQKASGAPLGGTREKDPLDFKAVGPDGEPVLPENAHVRLTAPEQNNGRQILRRGYAYDNGAAWIAERWPPWRQGRRYDAGLLFICFQKDLRTGFIPLFEKVSRFDALNQFVTTVGGGFFACPGGVLSRTGFVGQALFEARK